MKNIFIISLPRSGSTLLQRILTTHPAISSIAEPWILLPFASLSESGKTRVCSDFSYRLSQYAFEDFIETLPNKIDDYYKSMSSFIDSLYEKAVTDGSYYFLDKTPRYYLIVDFIYKLFPDAKIIFLVRNPLEVISSMIETWWDGRLWLNHQHIDLFRGPFCINSAVKKYAKESFLVNYEALVNNPDSEINKICDFLGIDYSEEMVIDSSNSKFQGRMGDKIGIEKYSGISQNSLHNWPLILKNPVRKRFALNYLRYLGPEVLDTFGCDRDTIEEEIKKCPSSLKGTFRDSYGLILSFFSRKLCLKLVQKQLRNKHASLLD